MAEYISNISLNNVDYEIRDQRVDRLSADKVTPQMFGAVGDGVADDTEAVQAALDSGGLIYFPAGRYKVTKQLTVSKSCKIEMFKPYPATHQAEYPLTSDDNWMGSRIETYSTDAYGLLIGDAVEINGLFLRAMTGFNGVLLKLDTTIGTYTYQAGVRLSHVKLENDSSTTWPESMFDFTPDGSYHYILNDIGIGRSPSHFRCTYGFRADLSNTPRRWCNNVFIRNMCIDMKADYPVYVDGADGAAGWVFDGLTIQGYNFDPGHSNMIVLKNLHHTMFTGCYLWDLAHAHIIGEAILTENVLATTCVGCSDEFDAVETVLRNKMKLPENLNITNLELSVTGDEATGGNVLTLSDGNNTQEVLIPAATLSDSQIGSAVGNWMSENASAKEVVGRNKLDVNSEDCVIGFFYWGDDTHTSIHYDKSVDKWTSNYIEAIAGDVIRISKNGVLCQAWNLQLYDADKQYIGSTSITAGNSDGQDYKAPVVTLADTAYIRITFGTSFNCYYDNRFTDNLCVTVNNTDRTYEPYQCSLEGGMSEWLPMDEITETIKGESLFVLYEAQELSETEKAIARNNIGAVTVDDVLAALPTWTGGSY